MEETTFKRTEITLRPFQISDVDAFFEWAGDEDVSRYCRWNTFTSKEEAMDFLKEVTRTHPWYRAICYGGRPVGSIFVMPGVGKDEQRGDIGYALAAKVWGKGIATEAVKMAVSGAFKEMKHLDKVEAMVIAENKASQKVLVKAGFVKEVLLRNHLVAKGITRDMVIYSITRSSDKVPVQP